MKSSRCRKQWAERFFVKEAGDSSLPSSPQSEQKCKRRPWKCTHCTISWTLSNHDGPSELYLSTSGQGAVMYWALEGQMVQKKNVTWEKSGDGMGRAPQKLACRILFSLPPYSPPILAKMT